MDAIRILCYGDSNTWGYIPGTSVSRYGNNVRWTKVLSGLLGSKYEVIEEGLSSRTIISDDTRAGKEGRNGYHYLIPCLDTHDPIDMVILMLGTNELKFSYQKTPVEIGEMLEEYLVKTILGRKSVINGSSPKLLIVAPPIVDENTQYCKTDNKYSGASQKSKELNSVYERIAQKYNCSFLDNTIFKTGVDGVHLTEESHRQLAQRLKEKIEAIFDNRR